MPKPAPPPKTEKELKAEAADSLKETEDNYETVKQSVDKFQKEYKRQEDAIRDFLLRLGKNPIPNRTAFEQAQKYLDDAKRLAKTAENAKTSAMETLNKLRAENEKAQGKNPQVKDPRLRAASAANRSRIASGKMSGIANQLDQMETRNPLVKIKERFDKTLELAGKELK